MKNMFFIPFLLFLLFILSLCSCDNFIEEEPTKEVRTKYFTVKHSSLDDTDLERLDRWFNEFCTYYDDGHGICGFMAQEGRTEIRFDSCENIRGRAGWRINGFTFNRASAKLNGDGTTIVVCNLTKELMQEEFSHAMLLEYQNANRGVSPTILEACAVGMIDNLGAKKRNWSDVTPQEDAWKTE